MIEFENPSESLATPRSTAPAPDEGAPDRAPVAPPPRLAAGPLIMAVVAAVAAVGFWFLQTRYGEVAQRDPQFANMIQMSLEMEQDLRRVNRINSTVAYAILGAVLGGLTGLTEGLMRRSPFRLALGLLAGVVLGAAFGLGAGVTANYLYGFPALVRLSPLVHTAILLAGALAVMGIGVGLAMALPSGSLAVLGRTVVGAVVGALFAAVAYLLLVSLVFPKAGTEGVLPKGSENRLLWAVASCVLIAATAAWQGRTLGRPPADRPEAP